MPGVPVRNYSWPPFEPGNTASLSHGVYSARTWKPLAERIQAELPDIAPWTSRSTYSPAVAAWARTEAQLQLILAWLDEHGPLDGDGVPRPATSLMQRLEAHARELRNDLGLSPVSLAKLLSLLDSAPAGTDDRGLASLVSEGHQIIEARTAALAAGVDASASQGHDAGRDALGADVGAGIDATHGFGSEGRSPVGDGQDSANHLPSGSEFLEAS